MGKVYIFGNMHACKAKVFPSGIAAYVGFSILRERKPED